MKASHSVIVLASLQYFPIFFNIKNWPRDGPCLLMEFDILRQNIGILVYQCVLSRAYKSSHISQTSRGTQSAVYKY